MNQEEKKEEDFWDQTSVKAFDFEKDEENGKHMCGVSQDGITRLSQQIRDGIKTDNDLKLDSFQDLLGKGKPRVDLSSLISDKALYAIITADSPDYVYFKTDLDPEEELKLLRRQTQNKWSPPEVSSTLRKILLNQPFSLELYKSLNGKKALLKQAVEMGDGDAILEVVTVLSSTLKKTLFYQVLSSSPEGVSHYVHFLSTRMQIQEVSDILEMLGKSSQASMKQFIIACQNPQRQLQRLTLCARNYFVNSRDKHFVQNYIKLLEWQQEVKKSDIQGQPVLKCLAFTCEHHWGESKGALTSPQTLVSQQEISERQFHWVAFISRAKLSAWDDLKSMFISKSWLWSVKKPNPILPMEQVVLELHKIEAPSNVLLTYLELIDNNEKKLALAKKIQSHRTVIDIYASQRNRQAILNYKATVSPQSEEYFHADYVLRSDVKWKN